MKYELKSADEPILFSEYYSMFVNIRLNDLIMKRQILLIIFTILSFISYSQEEIIDYAIDYISTKEGLPHNYVSKVVSDSLNIKWIAQETGITKYDGSSFTKIEPGPIYSGLKNENIETLFLDSKNRLWIGTKSGGLSMLDIKTNYLENCNEVFSKEYNGILRVISFTEDSRGHIWFGSMHNGLFVIDPVNKVLVRKDPSPEVRVLLTDSKGNVWFSANNILKKYDPSEDRTFSFPLSRSINSIVEDVSRNCLWIATNHDRTVADYEVYKFDFITQKINGIPTGIKHPTFKSLFLDRFNRLWIGTWGAGVYRSNSNLTNFNKVNLVRPQNATKIVNYENIIDIHADRNNEIWLSTTFAGLVKLTESKGFKNLDKIITNQAIKEELNFQGIFKDSESVWLGTLRSGLYMGEDFANLKKIKTVENAKVYSISCANNNMLIGGNRWFYILGNDGRFINKIKIRKATSTFLQGNMLWVGTQEQGISLFDISDINNPVAKSIFNIFGGQNKIESNRITSIVKDSNDLIWIGTYNGVHYFDSDQNKFIHQDLFFDEQMPNIINVLYPDNGFLWAGTPNGLYQLKYEQDKLKIINIYDETSGLTNDFICGITSTNSKNIWLATPTNLFQFDFDTKVFHQFGMNDGIATSQFNIRSFYNYNDEMILAGGADNLTYFSPSSISNSTVNNDIIISKLSLNNEVVLPGDKINGRVILEKDINYTDKIELSHREKSLYLEFSHNNYRNDIATYYRYKIIGYEEDWVNLYRKSEVNIMGLPPGNYEFLISASIDNVNWLTPKKLQLKVLYAPWLSPLAYSFYILVVLLIIGFGIFFVMKELHARNKIWKEKEISEAKLTFFTNISHEFRTPLTLILSPLKELSQSNEFSGKTIEKLRTMEKNAVRLLNLINQLLDFRKAGHGLLKLNLKPGNFVNFSHEVFLYFKEMAGTKKIDYQFEAKTDEIILPFDRNKMEIVLCNLISNSMKYSSPGCTINLKIAKEENECVVELSDTGYGMTKESKKRIFDRFYQINSTNTTNIIGSGIGLSFTKKIVELHQGTIHVQSEINKGSVFSMKFPMELGYNEPVISEEKVDETHEDSSIQANQETITDLKVEIKENTLLIVDDNEEIRNYLKQLLSDEYNILEACDGVEAIEVASEYIPDLILCDIMMPRKDGLETCKFLKTQIKTSHIPIILLTARSSNMYELQSLETGADDFITKPFDPKIIQVRISSALQNRIKLREYFLNKVRFERTTGSDKVKDPETEFIEKVIQLVEENLMDENFGIETILDKFHLSQSTLYRKIKSLTGLSLTGFIRSVRLKKAAEIILKENEKLNIVAIRVGFNDYKYFGECFKKQFDCLPSEYKKKKNVLS